MPLFSTPPPPPFHTSCAVPPPPPPLQHTRCVHPKMEVYSGGCCWRWGTGRRRVEGDQQQLSGLFWERGHSSIQKKRAKGGGEDGGVEGRPWTVLCAALLRRGGTSPKLKCCC